MTAFEDRQRQAAFERRSSWSPPWATSGDRNLYAAEQAQAEALHMERIRQSTADMADLIEHARQGEFRETD
jgi:hypothetical protein